MAGRVVLIHEGTLLVDSDMDRLHENYSLALVPYENGNVKDLMINHVNCLAVRERSDAMHAVFGLDPAAAQTLLERDLGITGARCRTVALEEMFIELVEGQEKC